MNQQICGIKWIHLHEENRPYWIEISSYIYPNIQRYSKCNYYVYCSSTFLANISSTNFVIKKHINMNGWKITLNLQSFDFLKDHSLVCFHIWPGKTPACGNCIYFQNAEMLSTKGLHPYSGLQSTLHLCPWEDLL